MIDCRVQRLKLEIYTLMLIGSFLELCSAEKLNKDFEILVVIKFDLVGNWGVERIYDVLFGTKVSPMIN